MQKTVKATGVGRTTVYKIRKEAKQAGAFSSEKRPQKREHWKGLDDFDETAVVRNNVHEFYTVRRQLPTIMNLHEALKEDIATLAAILHRGELCSSLASN